MQLFDPKLVQRIPPHLFFLVSATFHYLGPAFAVLLFSHVDVLGVAWMRIASAALIFAVWRRPWRILSRQSWTERRVFLAFGLVLGLMNAVFYEAIARLPLSTVGAIEFIGPVFLAAVGVRTPRNLVALSLAASGGWVLTGVRVSGDLLGFLFAFANCAFFMLYVMLGHRIAQNGGTTGIDLLGSAMLIAVLVISPFGFIDALPAFRQPNLLLAGIGVGVCSSVIPYISDQLAMARLPRASFALLLSLLPAMGTAIGIVILSQIPTPFEVIGIFLVGSGVALHHEREVDSGREPHLQPQNRSMD